MTMALDYKAKPKTSMGNLKVPKQHRRNSPMDNDTQYDNAPIPPITEEERLAAYRTVQHLAIINGCDGVENVLEALALI